MSPEQHGSAELSSRPPLTTENPTGEHTIDYLQTCVFKHTEPSDDPQCSTAMNMLHPLSQHDHIPTGHETSTERHTERRWVNSWIPDIYYTEKELQQPFPVRHPITSIQYSPVVDFTASVNSLSSEPGSCGSAILEWTSEWGPLLSSTSFIQPTYGHGMSDVLMPQMSPSLLSSPTATTSQLSTATFQSLSEALSPSDNQGQYICEECNKHKSDLKSLNRHMTEVHRKPPRGQVQRGWFTCVCGYQACYSRRSNYTRHLQKCKPTTRVHQEYICQCLIKHIEKADHEKHSQTCKEGAGHVGRPRRHA